MYLKAHVKIVQFKLMFMCDLGWPSNLPNWLNMKGQVQVTKTYRSKQGQAKQDSEKERQTDWAAMYN